MLHKLEYFTHMKSITVNNLIFDEYLSKEEIAAHVADVAERINTDYEGREPLFICVLNGAFMYASDLLKHITLPAEITFVRLKSYEGTATTGKVNMLIPLQTSIVDRDIIIIEDIVDSGRTMHGMVEKLKSMGVGELRIATLFFKPEKYLYDMPIKYCAMEIGNEFIVGYGLDYDQLGRNLKDIYVLAND